MRRSRLVAVYLDDLAKGAVRDVVEMGWRSLRVWKPT